MSRNCPIALSVLLSCCIFAATAAGQDLKVEKYQLPNGMTVILHEDHSLPLACINTWYYVGSKDEPPGRSGFAHLFEHLMFMGTRRVPGSDFDVLMESGGGANNASTTQDRTNYFSSGPAALLPTLLWLDADRLEDLGKEMTQQKLDKQREVVRNERRQTSEMQPYGRARLKISELMFPPGHPYHNTVIGSHEDLTAATVRDVKDFFARFYMPNNASLVVAGDFDPQTIKPLIAKLFGTLPRGAAPARRTAEPVKLDEVRRATYYDRVQFAKTIFVYHSPPHFQPGDAEISLAAGVLAGGKSSRLYKRLVYDDKIAVDVSANQNSMSLGSLFSIEVTARQSVSLDKIEHVVDDVLAEFLSNGPTQEELERRIAGIEYRAVSRVQALLQKADKLNEYQFGYGEPDSFQRDLDRFRNADPAAVHRWAGRVLSPNARLIMRILPEPRDDVSARDKRPGAAAEHSFVPEMPTSFKLSNGIEVRHWRRSDLPLVSVELLLRGGACRDGNAQAGRAFLTTRMLDAGAAGRGALEFGDSLEQLGASFSARCSQEAINVDLSVLKRNFEKALGLYADAILRPRLDANEWERVRMLHLQELERAEDQPAGVATRVGMRTFFGDAHPYGRPVEGVVHTVQNLNLESVKVCHQLLFQPDGAVFFIAGDLTVDEAKAALEKAFGGWTSTTTASDSDAVARRPVFPEPVNQSRKVVIVDRPGSVQTVIRFFMPGPAYKSSERVKLELLNTILGGSFTSRLNQNLREKHGFTYGARSRFAMEPSAGYFSSGADVQTEHTGEALREFFAEFKRLRKGDVSKEEAGKARETNRSARIQSFQGLSGMLNSAAVLEQNGLPFATIADDLNTIGATTEAELNRLAGPGIPLGQLVLVLVGDKQLVLEQLKDLDLPAPVEMTASGEVKLRN
jgi:predicted Zn-dependent peptidase